MRVLAHVCVRVWIGEWVRGWAHVCVGACLCVWLRVCVWCVCAYERVWIRVWVRVSPCVCG